MGLSLHTLNKQLTAINAFSRYLDFSSHGALSLPESYKIKQGESRRTVLTEKEIKLLYEATYVTGREGKAATGQRARAILAIYYGSGLRLSEGHALNIDDINLNDRIIHVKSGKGRKERYVPIVSKQAEHLKEYIEDGRYWFMTVHNQNPAYQKPAEKPATDKEALFLSQKGSRLGKNTILQLVNKLTKNARIDKQVSPHVLRHSIATHLLQNGMELEQIKQFLGHASLESTQIYTHLAQELDPSTL